mgnify:CR=1 FL=1
MFRQIIFPILFFLLLPLWFKLLIKLRLGPAAGLCDPRQHRLAGLGGTPHGAGGWYPVRYSRCNGTKLARDLLPQNP